MKTETLLNVQSSSRLEGSVTREISQAVIETLQPNQIVERDLVDPLPFVDAQWVAANFTSLEQRSEEQKHALMRSDALVAELNAADTIVLGVPIYNFGVPAAFKAWIDLVARVGLTFKYGDSGPVGLLTRKQAIVVIASGGTEVGSEIDFASPYIKHVLAFLGISDLTLVSADSIGSQREDKIREALEQIDGLA